MIKYYSFALLITMLTACTSSIGVMATSKEGEYVSIARNMAGPFSSLELAQQEAINNAIEHCKKMDLSYKKLYAIDRPMAVAQAPESSLYFTCVAIGSNDQSQAIDSTSVKSETEAPSSPMQKNEMTSLEGVSLEMQALILALDKKGILKKEDVAYELQKLKGK